jgi:hypothetical protein
MGESLHDSQESATWESVAGDFLRKTGPLLTVIVPVYNEQVTIKKLLQTVLDAPYDKQVIVVDDCSTDATARILATFHDEPGVDVLRHAVNRGKGAAIRTGLERSRGLYTIVQDADLEYNPCDYPRLLEPLLSGAADVVFGSRYLRSPEIPRPPRRMLDAGVALLNLSLRLLYGVRLTDEATCYKVFPTAILRAMNLRCDRFEFCPEVTAKACRMGLQILEVPIHYAPRTVHEGKKLRWSDGVAALRTLWRWRRYSPTSPVVRSSRVESPQGSAGEMPAAT